MPCAEEAMCSARWIAVALVAVACQQSSQSPVVVPAEGGAAEIGPAGATIQHGGVTLTVPAGASARGTLTIGPAAGYPATEGLASAVYDLGPEGTPFAPPATLSIAVEAAEPS